MVEQMGERDGDMRTVDENRLCMACGLCCDGTLFVVVPVAAAEIPALKESPVRLATGQDGRGSLVQPCHAYSGSCCGIYERRPQICREWDCYVLEGYRRKTISMDEARERIRQAHALKKDLMQALQSWEPDASEAALPVLWRRWNALATGDDGVSFRQERGVVLMRMAALNCYLERYFRPGETET